MSDTTVHVKNISSQTSESEVREFFSFCGKISSISVAPAADTNDGSQTASVTFEKPTAAKTALLLDNTQLGPNLVQVTSNATLDDMSGLRGVSDEHSHDGVAQEDKPRSRIFAEYLAHGYHISDKAIERAIAVDNQHGISSRFTSALQTFDQKTKASEKAQQVDTKFGVTEKAMAAWSTMNSYFEKAAGTQSGQKVREFYLAGNKQVMDVHTEARRLADMKDGKSPVEHVPGTDKTSCGCNGDPAKCGCEPGKCACSSCPKNADVPAPVGAEAAGLQKLSPESNRTACGCAGDHGQCACAPGTCACSDCPKNPQAVKS